MFVLDVWWVSGIVYEGDVGAVVGKYVHASARIEVDVAGSPGAQWHPLELRDRESADPGEYHDEYQDVECASHGLSPSWWLRRKWPWRFQGLILHWS